MGFDINSVNFIRYVADKAPLKATATLGRQCVYLEPRQLFDLVKTDLIAAYGDYADRLLLEYFKAESLESFDYSNYEKATHILDLGQEQANLPQYDSVLDIGTLEHIYNVPMALKNISRMCKPGGQIVHILPANSQNGHGFWQFSPELFFSLYSVKNGYAETEMFFVDLDNEDYWFKIKQPSPGERLNLSCSNRVQLCVRTRLPGAFSHAEVYQSDYLHAWTNTAYSSSSSSESYFRKSWNKINQSTLIGMLAKLFGRDTRSQVAKRCSLTDKNPYLQYTKVVDLLAGS